MESSSKSSTESLKWRKMIWSSEISHQELKISRDIDAQIL